MASKQTLKAAARKNAKLAQNPDTETAEQAVSDAKANARKYTPQQPHYVTQNKDAGGENSHHGKDKIVSEFDDPAAHKVR